MDSLPKSSNLKKFVKNSEKTAAGIQVSKPARKEVCLSWLPTMWWMTIVVWIKEVEDSMHPVYQVFSTYLFCENTFAIHTYFFKNPYLLHTFGSFN